MNPRPQAPGAKPSYTDLESALVAGREAREKLEAELDEIKLSGPPPTRDELDVAAENVRLRDLYENVTQNRTRFGWTINHLLECEEALRCSEERAERAEEALRRIWNADVPLVAGSETVQQDLREFARASLSAVPASPEKQEPVPVNIARCPVHGLHGERDSCFVCGGPVEQVPMVAAPQPEEENDG